MGKAVDFFGSRFIFVWDFVFTIIATVVFFRRELAEGLEIRSLRLGMGKLQLIDIKQLYDIGMRLIKEDPRILLCDDRQCLFCRKYQ